MKDNIIPIEKIAKKLKLNNSDLEFYGEYKAKIKNVKGITQGKLVLVTSINPTPYGEGKTTVSIGINDALRKLKKNSVCVLREPSLGPVFGIKGGATGGGKAKIIPSDDINLHFTGDFHAITSANNLICAVIDNHIYQGNELKINPNTIVFHRCMDMNDRILRDIQLSNRREKFDITAASEMMAIITLCTSMNDLKKRVDRIIIGYSTEGKELHVSDLGCTEAVAILLKDAIKPNLVQSLENNPVIVHGGPFGNIAHGCASLIATKTALSLADYVIEEAGFGSDLGGEKFLDIKCRNGIRPNCIVVNFTLRSLKHNAYCKIEEIDKPNENYIKQGFENLRVHIENMRKYTNNIVVCLNRFSSDTKEEVELVANMLKEMNLKLQICDSYLYGSKGSIELAKEIMRICKQPLDFKFLYIDEESIESKITKIINEIYRCNVEFSENAKKSVEYLDAMHYNKFPICISKTQYSLTDNKEILGFQTGHTIKVDRLDLKAGAGYILVHLANIISMPGLSKYPNLLNMKIEGDKIEGIN